MLACGKLGFCDRPYTRGVVRRSGNATRRLRSPYLLDTYATSTPKAVSFNASDLSRMPVVVLAFVAPGNLQGFSAALSHALGGALAEVAPPVRQISTTEI